MLETNPFSILAETVSPFAMQSFIIAMIILIALGTIIQMIHHKNITYFFNNAKKAKLQATREIGAGEKVSIIPCGIQDKGITNLSNIANNDYSNLDKLLIEKFISNLKI